MAKDAKLSSNLRDMVIVNDNLYVADEKRGVVLIIKG